MIETALINAYILSVVQCDNGGTYSYAIWKTMNQMIEISESTVYSACKRLERQSCLESTKAIKNGRLQLCYHITAQGKQTMNQCKKELLQFSEKIKRIEEISLS